MYSMFNDLLMYGLYLSNLRLNILIFTPQYQLSYQLKTHHTSLGIRLHKLSDPAHHQ